MTLLSRLFRHPNTGMHGYHHDGDASIDPLGSPSAQHSSTTLPRSTREHDASLRLDHAHQGPTPPASKIFLDSLIHLRLRNLPSSATSTETTSETSCAVASLPPPTCTHVECMVCCEHYQEYDVVCLLPCGHMFHSACIVDWLERRSSCPVCREDFPTDDIVFEYQKAKVAAAKREQEEEKANGMNEQKVETGRSKSKQKNRGSSSTRPCAHNHNDDTSDYYDLPSHNLQDDMMFLPPNLSLPLDTDDEHESSDEEGDFAPLPQNFDLIMRRVLRSKADLRAKQQKHHP